MNPPYVNVIQSSDYIVQEGDTLHVDYLDGVRRTLRALEVVPFGDDLIAYHSPSGVVLVPAKVNVRVEEVEAEPFVHPNLGVADLRRAWKPQE